MLTLFKMHKFLMLDMCVLYGDGMETDEQSDVAHESIIQDEEVITDLAVATPLGLLFLELGLLFLELDLLFLELGLLFLKLGLLFLELGLLFLKLGLLFLKLGLLFLKLGLLFLNSALSLHELFLKLGDLLFVFLQDHLTEPDIFIAVMDHTLKLGNLMYQVLEFDFGHSIALLETENHKVVSSLEIDHLIFSLHMLLFRLL